MKALRRWRQLDAAAKRTLIAAAALSLLMRIALAFMSWKAVQRLSARRVAADRDDAALPRIVWAVEVSERRLPWLTCFSQSLAARWLLAGAGMASDVQLGAYREAGGAMHFHASVVCAGREIYGAREMTSLAVVGAPSK